MLAQQEKYMKFIEGMEENVSKVESLNIEDFKLNDLKEAVVNVELLVPVVGAFSAGKSSLLNSFLGKTYLSVDVSPETALATELRYSQEEYIQVVKNDGSLERFNIEEAESLKARASEFRFARYFINQQALKDIEPIILVDMPGFESPLDSHNKAILEIERGVFFIVLQDIQNGNLTKTILNRLEEIRIYQRDFALFLSKANLMPPEDVTKISNKFEEQLYEYFGVEKTIYPVDDNGGESLQTIVKQINPNAIIVNLFQDILKDKFSDIKQAINTSIHALNNSQEKNQQILKELQESIKNLEAEQVQMVREVESRYGSKGLKSIIESVDRSLRENIDNIAQEFVDNGADRANALINEIVRITLADSVQNAMRNINEEIIADLSAKLKSLEQTMANLTDNAKWGETLSDGVKTLSPFASSAFGSLLKFLVSKGGILATIGLVLAPLEAVILPILLIVASVLPSLFTKSEAEKREEKLNKVKEGILTQSLPQIKNEIRLKLPAVFNAQVSEIIAAITNDFKEKINQQVGVLENTQAKINAERAEVENKIKAYKEVLSAITSLANQFIY